MFLNNRGVRIKRVEFRENVCNWFLFPGTKQTVRHNDVSNQTRVRKVGLECTNISEQFLHGPLGQIAAREIRIMALSPPRDSR